MELQFNGNLLNIDDAKIIYRNFKGVAGKFNREGDRSFAVIIPSDELATALIKEGWNVKIKPPREDGEEPFRYLPVAVKFNDRGPGIYLKTNNTGNMVRLNEETVECLDNIDIISVSLDIRPYDWEVNGQKGRKAYLSGMKVVQKVDRFGEEYERQHLVNDNNDNNGDLPF
jgi:hypothetical protein